MPTVNGLATRLAGLAAGANGRRLDRWKHRPDKAPGKPLRAAFVVVLVLAWSAAAKEARSADSPAQNIEAERVVHLLDYVGADYGAALGEGGVRNDRELAEQLEILTEAVRIATKLKPAAMADPTFQPVEAVSRVTRLVEALRPAADVAAAAKAARGEIAAFFDLIEAPSQAPSHERGRQLYEQHCAGCHGADGRADTPRAAEYVPRPANFRAREVLRHLSPLRTFTTVRFGIPNTPMVPFDFLSEAERWDLAFYVSALDHSGPPSAMPEARMFSLGELAAKSDDALREDLGRAGIAEDSMDQALGDLRGRAPYDPETLHPKGASQMVLRGRADLRKLGALFLREDREGAKSALLRTYLDDVEPLEAPLRAAAPALALDIERRFKELRRDIDDGVPRADLDRKLEALITRLTLAGRTLEAAGHNPSFVTTMFSSTGIALREGAEAALLIAALLAAVTRAGPRERRRWVHGGWITALAAGGVTWLISRRFVQMSGLGRELVEGVTALLASAVLFYVSYWLFAKRESARWVTYLRSKASGGAAFSLFGISFLAVYREAFETVIFYQALLAQPGSTAAAGLGALLGGAVLAGVVIAYGRAGKFAPPRAFFAFSSLLLYALAVVFAGQGISALQTTGHLPFHPVRLPTLPALGVYSTVETYAVQATLIALAIGAAIFLRAQRTPPTPPGPPGDGMARSREGAKL